MVAVNRPGTPTPGVATLGRQSPAEEGTSVARPPARPAADTNSLGNLSGPPHARSKALGPRSPTWPLTASMEIETALKPHGVDLANAALRKALEPLDALDVVKPPAAG